ncbi:MAG: cytochrome P460 family protein, partial [Bdellovibrio sp.]|nr:cytochrome P460 family protein [Bdellovibrio sp.]
MQIFFTLLLTLVANAYFEIPATSKKSEMNQISFEKYKNFPTEWNLVTVRYRNDNKELRFIYANNIAFQHLLSESKKSYPEGSAFGKTAYITAQDPHFPSSMVPSTNRRFQFMVKDSKKYAATNGWGYALFNSEGVIYKE